MDDGGTAVAEFAMVCALLMLIVAAVLQLAVVLHVRNTLTWCASEGARYGARADSSPVAGAARTRQLISDSVSPAYASQVHALRTTVGGVDVVEVRVRAPIPALALIGAGAALSVSGRAFAESQT